MLAAGEQFAEMFAAAFPKGCRQVAVASLLVARCGAWKLKVEGLGGTMMIHGNLHVVSRSPLPEHSVAFVDKLWVLQLLP